MVLLANEANIANFIFKDGLLISQNYVDGKTGLYLDGKTGVIKANVAQLGAFRLDTAGNLTSGAGNNDLWIRGPGIYPQTKPLVELDIDGSNIRLGKDTSGQDNRIFQIRSSADAYISNLEVGKLKLSNLASNAGVSGTWRTLCFNPATWEVRYQV